MDKEDLNSKCSAYKTLANSYLELVDVYKKENEELQSQVIGAIENAGVQAVSFIEHLKEGLIEDAKSHISNQFKAYESYQRDVADSLADVSKVVAEANSHLDNPQLTKAAQLKLSTALLDLGKPDKRVISFIGQWEDLSKSDLGIIVSNTIKHSPPHSSAMSAKRQSQRRSAIRFPVLKGITSFGLPRTPTAAGDAVNSKENRTGDQMMGEQPVANQMENSCDVTASGPARSLDGGTLHDVSTNDLIQSAFNEWSIQSSQPASVNTSFGMNSTSNGELSQYIVLDELEATAVVDDGQTTKDAGGEEVWDEDSKVPEIHIQLSSLSLGGADSEDKSKYNSLGANGNGSVDVSYKDTSPTAITRYLGESKSKGVIQAELIATLGGANLGLKFPIGTCVYKGGLVVCNSGDNRVYVINYMEEGVVTSKIEIEGRFTRPSAVVVDNENNLYIKDDKCIRKYDSNLVNSVTFPNCVTRPYGLALTPDNHLITMCDCGYGRGLPKGPSLLKFSTDGELVSTIPLYLPLKTTTKLRFMDIFGDVIYISDLGASFVYKVNVNTGQLLKVLAQPGRQAGFFTEPSGIACDRDGNILIADSKGNRVQIFDGAEGKYKGMLDCQGGLVRPSGIYLDSEDHLYAVNYIAHSVNIYKLTV